LKAVEATDLGERGLIRELRSSCPGMRGIGDDCAVLDSLATPLVTTDSYFEGTHFHRWWAEGFILGRRLLEASLSDIAAMGGKPVCAFAAIMVPPDLHVDWLKEFYSGLTEREDCQLAGGETIRGGTFGVTITVVGEGDDRDTLLRRDSLKPGDRLWVSGKIGRALGAPELLKAACGLKGRELVPARDMLSTTELQQVRAFLEPRAELELGRRAREMGLMCGIDISDGLLSESAHLAEESGVDVVVELRSEFIMESVSSRPIEASSAGEDYILLLAADETMDLSGDGCFPAGYALPGSGGTRVLLDGEEVEAAPMGYDHLKG